MNGGAKWDPQPHVYKSKPRIYNERVSRLEKERWNEK